LYTALSFWHSSSAGWPYGNGIRSNSARANRPANRTMLLSGRSTPPCRTSHLPSTGPRQAVCLDVFLSCAVSPARSVKAPAGPAYAVAPHALFAGGAWSEANSISCRWECRALFRDAVSPARSAKVYAGPARAGALRVPFADEAWFGRGPGFRLRKRP